MLTGATGMHGRYGIGLVLGLLLVLLGPDAAFAAEPYPQQGPYANLTLHWEGAWQLTRTGNRVTATLGSTRSPVQYTARQVPAVLFTMPSGFRPQQAVTATVANARPVDDQGLPLTVLPRAFGLHVDTDGTVRYVDDARLDGVGFLAYTLTLGWWTEDAVCGTGPLQGRTQGVVDAITAAVPGVSRCRQVTAADLTALTALQVESLTTLRPGDFAGLNRLQELDLGCNALTALPPTLFADLPQLRVLDLGLDPYAPWYHHYQRWLGAFPRCANALTALPSNLFAHNPHLQALYLDANNLTVLSSGFLAHTPRLQVLDLSHNRLTNLPPDLFAHTPQLQILQLADNRLTALPPDLFTHTPQLQILDLLHNRLTALPPDLFTHTPQLQILDLLHNRLTALPPDLFTHTSDLRILDLARNHLTVLPPDLFAHNPRLHTLHLEHNQLTALPPELLVPLVQLARLGLMGNSLSCWHPSPHVPKLADPWGPLPPVCLNPA